MKYLPTLNIQGTLVFLVRTFKEKKDRFVEYKFVNKEDKKLKTEITKLNDYDAGFYLIENSGFTALVSKKEIQKMLET
ncbi:MAG: hypothetical protein ACOCT9_02365 [archaeon]